MNNNKYNKIEQDLDKLRNRMWQQAGRSPKQWFALVQKKAKQGLLDIKKAR